MAKVALSYGHGANTYEDKRSKFVVVDGKVYEEHTFNAAVGEKVRKIIEDHGVQVLVVQPPMGADVALGTRVKKAKEWGADIYWSIHANAGAASARGLAAFYYKGSVKGKRLAELYAKYCKEANFPVYSGDYMYESEPGTWSDFYELRETAMPSLLTENGFMTNAEDFKLIFQNADNFHDRLAVAHAKTILEYFGIAHKGQTTVPAPKQEVKSETTVVGLKRGDRGDIVKQLQYNLIKAGVPVNGGVDGAFGPGTEAAVKLFQQKQGLTVNGIADVPTLENLDKALSKKYRIRTGVFSSREDAEKIKKLLNDNGVQTVYIEEE